MRRLTGQDASFLYAETSTQYAHTLKLGILEPHEGESFEERRRFIEASLPFTPMWRWRIVPTPLGLHHPLAIEDPDFDISDHFHRAALPSPGGPRELADFVSEVVSRPLDRSRPLWEGWYVEGLEGGRTASLIKVHHTLADGATTARLLGEIATVQSGSDLPVDSRPWQPERIPTRLERVGMALRELPGHLAHIWPKFLRATRAARRRLAARGSSGRATGLYEGPHTFFNGMLSGSRRYAFASLPLEHLKEVKSAHTSTFNDVFLAVVSGAVRAYLEERNELPASTLTAACPVNTRTPDAPYVLNSVSNFCVKLATNVADPVERLASIHRDAALAKEEFDATRGAQLVDFMDLLPPPLRILVNRVPNIQKRLGGLSSINVVTSNVAGPREPLSMAGSRLETFYSVGPLSEGMGINITAYSYCDQFNVSVLIDPRMGIDAWHLVELLQASLEELRKASA